MAITSPAFSISLSVNAPRPAPISIIVSSLFGLSAEIILLM
jgi:hypothetical protein